MVHFLHSLKCSFGRFAVTHPLTYLWCCAAFGCVIGFALCGVLGLSVGSAIGHPTAGLYSGYALQFAYCAINADALTYSVNQKADYLRSLR